jgi:hypothetical protein
MVARDDGIVLTCSHVNRGKAERMIECLRRLGLDFARVVEGSCAGVWAVGLISQDAKLTASLIAPPSDYCRIRT